MTLEACRRPCKRRSTAATRLTQISGAISGNQWQILPCATACIAAPPQGSLPLLRVALQHWLYAAPSPPPSWDRTRWGSIGASQSRTSPLQVWLGNWPGYSRGVTWNPELKNEWGNCQLLGHNTLNKLAIKMLSRKCFRPESIFPQKHFDIKCFLGNA